MVSITKNRILKVIADTIGLQSVEGISNQLANQVVATIPADKKIANFFTGGTLSDGTSQTIKTTNSDRDTYLSNVSFSYAKDATNTANLLLLRSTINGQVTNLLAFRVVPSTADKDVQTMNFNPPIKLDRGVTIQLVSDNGTASIDVTAYLTGYTEED